MEVNDEVAERHVYATFVAPGLCVGQQSAEDNFISSSRAIVIALATIIFWNYF